MVAKGHIWYYAVYKGRIPGVYTSWDDAKAQVTGFPGAVYKRFADEVRAEAFVKYGGGLADTETPADDIKSVLQTPLKSLSLSKKDSVLVEGDAWLVAFTDGSCIHQGSPKAVGGIGVVFPFRDVQISEPLTRPPTATNNRAELTAILRAFQVAEQLDPAHKRGLRIFTDSEYSLKSMTRWMKAWKRNDWRKSSGEPVLNRDLLEAIDLLQSKRKLDMVHVKAHTGRSDPLSRWNDLADKLAQQATASAF
jgi:ribonuclease HI